MMTTDELITNIRNIENELRSATIIASVKNQTEATRSLFVSTLSELSVQINKLNILQLQQINAKLVELSPAIKDGIADLDSEIKKANDIVAIINTTSAILGLVARIIAVI